MMLLCASAMGDSASSSAQVENGRWAMDDRYRQPNTTGKKDSWSVAKCGNEIFLVKVPRSPRKQRFHPLRRSEAKFLTGERVTKAFYVNLADRVGFLVSGRWDDPVVRAEAQWIGYTFLTMLPEVMDKMNLSIQLDPATTTDRPPWPMSENPKDDDLDVHVGRHYEMETPRCHRPQQEPGLMVGHLYLDGCLVSRSETVSSASSSELRLVPLSEPTSQHNKTSAAPTVGYNRGPWRRNPAWDRCNLLYFEFKLGSTDAKILCPTGRGMGSCD